MDPAAPLSLLLPPELLEQHLANLLLQLEASHPHPGLGLRYHTRLGHNPPILLLLSLPPIYFALKPQLATTPVVSYGLTVTS